MTKPTYTVKCKDFFNRTHFVVLLSSVFLDNCYSISWFFKQTNSCLPFYSSDPDHVSKGAQDEPGSGSHYNACGSENLMPTSPFTVEHVFQYYS